MMLRHRDPGGRTRRGKPWVTASPPSNVRIVGHQRMTPLMPALLNNTSIIQRRR
jgi:hypothetical protein